MVRKRYSAVFQARDFLAAYWGLVATGFVEWGRPLSFPVDSRFLEYGTLVESRSAKFWRVVGDTSHLDGDILRPPNYPPPWKNESFERPDDLSCEFATLLRRWEEVRSLESPELLAEAARAGVDKLLLAFSSMKFCFGTADSLLAEQVSEMFSALRLALASQAVTDASRSAYARWIGEMLQLEQDSEVDPAYYDWLRQQRRS